MHNQRLDLRPMWAVFLLTIILTAISYSRSRKQQEDRNAAALAERPITLDNAPFAEPAGGARGCRFYNSFAFKANSWDHRTFAVDDGWEVWYRKNDPKYGLRLAVQRIGANGEPFAEESQWVDDGESMERIVPGGRGALFMEEASRDSGGSRRFMISIERNFASGPKLMVVADDLKAVWHKDRFYLLAYLATGHALACKKGEGGLSLLEVSSDGAGLEELSGLCLDADLFGYEDFLAGQRGGADDFSPLSEMFSAKDVIGFVYLLHDRKRHASRIVLAAKNRAGLKLTTVSDAPDMEVRGKAAPSLTIFSVQSDGEHVLVDWIADTDNPNKAPSTMRYAVVDPGNGVVKCSGGSPKHNVFQAGSFLTIEGDGDWRSLRSIPACGHDGGRIERLWKKRPGEHGWNLHGMGRFLFLTEGRNSSPDQPGNLRPSQEGLFRLTLIRCD